MAISQNNEKYTFIQKNGSQADWDSLVNFVPKKGEIIIYNPDESHSYSRMKVGDGVHIPKDLPFVSGGSSGTIGALEHSLTFGAGGEYVFDGSKDVVVPVYTGDYTIGN